MSEKTKEIIDRAEELCVLCEEEEAEKLIQDALKEDPDNLDLKTELAVILARRGYDHKTETILRDVLAEDHLHERAVSALGNLLGNSLRFEEAENLFKSFLVEQPHGHMILDDLTRILYDLERIEEALQLGRQHLAEYPQELAAYDGLKYVLEMQEDDLASDLADDPEDIRRLQRYADNLIEQFSILQHMKNCDIIIDCEDGQSELDVDEDVQRVIAEIRDIQQRSSRLEKKLPSKLMNRINAILSISEK
ncbi:MAG: tetratricopeptide repeat protein [Candidatus Thorarchaeota archaeon]|jgi:tetratricopeptide (TPR) repeat protein